MLLVVLLVAKGVLILKHKAMAEDTRPVDPTWDCMVCKNYTRAYIHCLVTKDAMGSQLLSYHNLYYMMKRSRNLHSSIIEGRFPEQVQLNQILLEKRLTLKKGKLGKGGVKFLPLICLTRNYRVISSKFVSTNWSNTELLKTARFRLMEI